MADTSIALSPTTRVDTFSDYIKLSAYKANLLTERARVASGRGSKLLKTWYLPMPQTIGRIVAHNYQVVEHSVAYALQKGVAQGRQAQEDAAKVSLASAGLMGSSLRRVHPVCVRFLLTQGSSLPYIFQWTSHECVHSSSMTLM